jgi:hypothetical protein
MNRLLRAGGRKVAPVAGMLVLAAATAGGAHAQDCDRTCLKSMITKYIDALSARDPARLPLAANARFTEDSRELKPGEGLWKTVVRMGGFRQDYIDLKAQIAAAHINVFEADGQVLHSVLLRVANRKIVGIETQAYRVKEQPTFKPPDSLGKPLVGMGAPVPAGGRMPRAGLIRVALTYTEGLRIGNFATAGTPFAKEAYRMEDGAYTAGEGCPSCPPMLSPGVHLHPDVKASVAAVDEEEGIVLLWMNFGDTNSYGPGNALVTFEAFKIWDGQIHAINAFFRISPKDVQRGWPSAD